MNNGQLTWYQRGQLWLRLGLRLLLLLLGVLLLWKFGGWVLSLLAPFVLAVVVAAALDPLVRWGQRRLGWNRRVLTMLLLLLLLGVAGGVLFWLGQMLVSEAVSLVNNWDALLAAAMEQVQNLDALLERLAAMLPVELAKPEKSLLDWLIGLVPTTLPQVGDLASFAGAKAAALSYFVVALVFFFMATYFLTADWPDLRQRVIASMDPRLRRFCGQVRTTALAAFGGYLRAELLLSVGVFAILAVGFVVTRQSYALLLALGLSVLDFIPIVGSGTVMVPWAVIALFLGDYPAAIRMMAIWGVIAMFRRVMEPKFVGDQTGLSPILSLVSIYVGMRLAGVWGMILAPILVLVCQNLAQIGLFSGVRRDLSTAADDIASILAGSQNEPS